MLLRRLAILGATAAALTTLSQVAVAQSAPPSIDLDARCRKSERAMIEMMGDPSLRESAFQTCMRAEQEARDALVKAWPEIPQKYKTFCVRKADYSPSYVEWIACLEMMIDLRRQRANSGTRPDPVSKRCPSIEYGADGSIKRIRACPL